MQTSNGVNHFRGINLGSSFTKLTLFSKISEHLTAVQKVDEEVEFGLRLEGIVETHNIWILNLFQNVSFGYIVKVKLFLFKRNGILVLTLGLDEKVLLDKLIFPQNLHRVWKTVILLSDQINFAEGSSSDNFEELEVVKRNLLAWNQEVDTFFIGHFRSLFFPFIVVILCWIIKIFNNGFVLLGLIFLRSFMSWLVFTDVECY